MTRRIIMLLTALFLMIAPDAEAQKLKKAFALLQKDSVALAQERFKKASIKKKDPVAASYGIGLTYMSDLNPRKDLKQAYTQLVKAKTTLRDKSYRKQIEYYAKAYQLDTNSIQQKINLAVRDIFLKTEQAGTIDQYYQFMHKYKESGPYYDLAKLRYDSLVAERDRMIAAEEERLWNSIFADPWKGGDAFDSLKVYLDRFKKTKYSQGRNLDSAIIYTKCRIVACGDNEAAGRLVAAFPGLADKVLSWTMTDQKTMNGWPSSEQIHAWYFTLHSSSSHYRTDKQLYDSVGRIYADYVFKYGELTSATKPTNDDEQRIQDVIASRRYRIPFDSAYHPRHESFYRYFAKEAAPHELAYVSVQKLMAPFIQAKNYTKAAEILMQYKPLFPHKEKMIHDTYRLLMNKPVEVINFRKLPATINEGQCVGYPVLSPDMKKLYYCVKSTVKEKGKAEYHEDIWVCDYDGGKCANPRRILSKPADTRQNPVGTTHDGKSLLVARGALIFRPKIDGDTIKGKATLHHWIMGYEHSACISSTGNVMLLSTTGPQSGGPGLFGVNLANIFDTIPRVGEESGPGWYLPFGRADTLGNHDIYAMTKEADGKWSYPIHIGGVVNTPFFEGSPVLASDGRTLYFVSDGHYGLGGADIYMTKRIHETSWTQWTPPVNLGLRINTEANDLEFCIGSDGKTMIIARGNQLYSLELPKLYCADPVHRISGQAVDTKGNPIGKARVVWEDLADTKPMGSLTVDSKTGGFFFTMPNGKNYGYSIEADGYLHVSYKIDTIATKKKAVDLLDQTFTLLSRDEVLRSGEPMEMANIFFMDDAVNLHSGSRHALRRFSKFVDATPGVGFEVSVYVDRGADGKTADELSEIQAKEIRDYLGRIDASPKIEVKGMGQGRARVEFRVVR